MLLSFLARLLAASCDRAGRRLQNMTSWTQRTRISTSKVQYGKTVVGIQTYFYGFALARDMRNAFLVFSQRKIVRHDTLD